MGICALLLHVVWLTKASENPAGGGGESRTRQGQGLYSFFSGPGWGDVLSELCSIQTKICSRQALEGDDIPPFLPKIFTGQGNGTPLCKGGSAHELLFQVVTE